MSEILTYNPDLAYAERPENDFYATPLNLCIAALKYIGSQTTDVLDTGVGTGNWGKAARIVWGKGNYLLGVELDKQFNTEQNKDIYDHIIFDNYLSMNKDSLDSFSGIRTIIGNPPYGKSGGVKGKFAELFIRKSAEILEPNGIIVYLLKASFRHSKDRNMKLFKEIPLYQYIPLAERPSFKAGLNRKTGKIRKGGTDATEYALFIFKKDSFGEWINGNLPTLIWKE